MLVPMSYLINRALKAPLLNLSRFDSKSGKILLTFDPYLSSVAIGAQL